MNEGLFAISTGDVLTSQNRKHTGGDNEVNDGCGDLLEHLHVREPSLVLFVTSVLLVL